MSDLQKVCWTWLEFYILLQPLAFYPTKYLPCVSSLGCQPDVRLRRQSSTILMWSTRPGISRLYLIISVPPWRSPVCLISHSWMPVSYWECAEQSGFTTNIHIWWGGVPGIQLTTLCLWAAEQNPQPITLIVFVSIFNISKLACLLNNCILVNGVLRVPPLQSWWSGFKS